MPKFKSKKTLKTISYGLREDSFCETDFSITRNTKNRTAKGNIIKTVKQIDKNHVFREFKKNKYLFN